MKLNETNAFKDFSLFLEVINFSAKKYLDKNTSIKINLSLIVNYLINASPIKIGRYNRWEVEMAIKDIYKKCFKNNRVKVKRVKLSRKHLKEYLDFHEIEIEGVSWLK